jgi:hypothetical protein
VRAVPDREQREQRPDPSELGDVVHREGAAGTPVGAAVSGGAGTASGAGTGAGTPAGSGTVTGATGVTGSNGAASTGGACWLPAPVSAGGTIGGGGVITKPPDAFALVATTVTDVASKVTWAFVLGSSSPRPT